MLSVLLNWFKLVYGPFRQNNMHYPIYLSAQIRQDGIEHTKAKKQLRSYCPFSIFYCAKSAKMCKKVRKKCIKSEKEIRIFTSLSKSWYNNIFNIHDFNTFFVRNIKKWN